MHILIWTSSFWRSRLSSSSLLECLVSDVIIEAYFCRQNSLVHARRTRLSCIVQRYARQLISLPTLAPVAYSLRQAAMMRRAISTHQLRSTLLHVRLTVLIHHGCDSLAVIKLRVCCLIHL